MDFINEKLILWVYGTWITGLMTYGFYVILIQDRIGF
jgi:hypothetical protein